MKKNVFDESVNGYQAPEIEVVEVMVEKGFASTPQLETPGSNGSI